MDKTGKGLTQIPCIVYAAKSSPDEQGSIPSQLADCAAAIEHQLGRFQYGESQSDENASAYKGNRGPGLAEAKRLAVEAAERHGQAELWVQHSDRLARGDGLTADHLAEVYSKCGGRAYGYAACRMTPT